ncbi:metal ABC transporter substrate-binding protein [Geobacter argillaceus]|uniref:Zinc transport system substrate-binding protein n=1 Tax=Geobacter argillaceus TaxID=345631 RepID=A0A562WSK2_9BACT|nr:metal ABC transporter substrate-binding protein [Geobacter argillaceus]TWJ33574.1 zinc transport system substrate-binding protein [Geobacter argillaceus]
MKRLLPGAILFAALCIVCACQKNDAPRSQHQKLRVVTTLFPLYDFAREIGGDKVDVTLLLPPGVEPHSFEPRPDDLVRISKADLFIFTSEQMEPWAMKLIKGVAEKSLLVVDSSKGARLLKAGAAKEHKGEQSAGMTAGNDGHHHGEGMDPHIWLDFSNARIMVDNMATGMATKDPANREYYTARAAAYKTELQKLDDEFKAGLATCGTREFLHGGHYAFGYLANRYGLTYRSAQAVNPDAEPTPATIAGLVKLMREHHLTYVYSEELLSPRNAEMIAKESGAKILMLHGAHNISKDELASGATFIALMKKNLATLRTGLQCR